MRSWVRGALERHDWRLPLDPRCGAPATHFLGMGGRVALAAWSDGTFVWSERGLLGGPPFRQGLLDEDLRRELREWLDFSEPLHALRVRAAAGGQPRPARDAMVAVVRDANVSTLAAPYEDRDAESALAQRALFEHLLRWIPREGGEPAGFERLEREVFPQRER